MDIHRCQVFISLVRLIVLSVDVFKAEFLFMLVNTFLLQPGTVEAERFAFVTLHFPSFALHASTPAVFALLDGWFIRVIVGAAAVAII